MLDCPAERRVRGSAFSCACALLLVAALLGLAYLVLPARAFANYNQAADPSRYAASQNVEVGGDPIDGSQIPDGVYSIDVATSSYMCLFKDCTLTVGGGAMVAEFTISKAYTALYFGTAEEAAAHTNADGTDASAYYLGDPPEGYVDHRFVLPVPALNTPLDIAAYTGGKGFEDGIWWSRQASFNSNSQIETAIANGQSGSPDPGQGEEQSPGGDSGSDPAPSQEPGGSGGSAVTPGGTDSSSGQEQTDDSSNGGGNEESGLGDDGGNQDSGDTGDDDTDDGNSGDTGDNGDTDDGNDGGGTDDANDQQDDNQAGDESGDDQNANTGNQPSTSYPTSTGGNGNGGTNGNTGLGTGAQPTATISQTGADEDKSKSSKPKDSEASSSSASAKKEAIPAGAIRARGISLAGVAGTPIDVSQVQQVEARAAEPEDNTALRVGAALFALFDLSLAGAFLMGLRRARPSEYPHA